MTQAFPGEEGKQRIIAAYLNQNYYGNETYGVAAAAKGYFGVELADLTLAQAAILAALLQSPVRRPGAQRDRSSASTPTADEETCEDTQLVVPADTTIVERRNPVLDAMERTGGTPLTGDEFTRGRLRGGQGREGGPGGPAHPTRWRVPHFVWQVGAS